MQTIDLIAAAIFFVSLLHIFAASRFELLALRYPRHSGLFHIAGEVEAVFGFWALVLVAFLALFQGGEQAIAYVESRRYAEPSSWWSPLLAPCWR
jgi:Putative Na+/H+ antiporter